MNKTEIREQIAKIICSLHDIAGECQKCSQGCPDSWFDVREEVDQILALPGICILADDQSLPAIVELKPPYNAEDKKSYDHYYAGWQNGQQKMLSNKFHKIK